MVAPLRSRHPPQSAPSILVKGEEFGNGNSITHFWVHRVDTSDAGDFQRFGRCIPESQSCRKGSLSLPYPISLTVALAEVRSRLHPL